MEKRELYEIIGRLYAQTCEMSNTEDELRKELEKYESDILWIDKNKTDNG